MNLYNKIFQYIASHKRGWVFSPSDLTHRFTRQQVDNALSHLVKNGKIRRIARGMYDYPEYDEFLGITLSPDIEKVKQGLARKYNWQLDVFSEVALTYLHLSTQLVVKNIYASSGPNKHYKLFNGVNIYFKHSSSKNLGFKYHLSPAIVQSLNALGKERIDNKVIEKIRKQYADKNYQ